MNNFFWKNKRVLITGHTGFVGTWLGMVLSFFGADVTGFALREEKGSLYDCVKKQLQMHSVYGDLRDKAAVEECIAKCTPEIVFHIAAFGFVKECHADPERAFSSNVQGTENLLEIIRRDGAIKDIVVASSDKVYRNGNQTDYLFHETDPLGGIDPYSASKTCEDILAQSYYEAYLAGQQKSMCIVRPSNILGAGDHHENRLVPGIFCALMRGEKPVLRNPNAVRPWQNVLDMVQAYLTIAEKGYHESGLWIYNVGPEPEGILSTKEIAEHVGSLFRESQFEKPGTVSRTESGEFRESEVREHAFLGLAIEKIKAETGWSPRRNIKDTLREIYCYCKENNGNNAYEICRRQIEDYYVGEQS